MSIEIVYARNGTSHAAGLSVQRAADAVVRDVLRPAGGEGGVIGMDRAGNVAVSLNVTAMGRGYVGADGSARIAFAADEHFSAD